MKQGILYTSYFAKFKKGVGNKISIARFNPKWLNSSELSAWCDSLAPSKELLNDYKYKGISWGEYTTRYYNEIKKTLTPNFGVRVFFLSFKVLAKEVQ